MPRLVPGAAGLACLATLLGGLSGCMKVGAAPTVPTVVVAVQNVAGAPLDASGAERPSARAASDGRSPGELVEVEWRGSWYPAVLLERRAEGWLVHYESYGDEWDEVVVQARIRDRTLEVEPDDPEGDPDP